MQVETKGWIFKLIKGYAPEVIRAQRIQQTGRIKNRWQKASCRKGNPLMNQIQDELNMCSSYRYVCDCAVTVFVVWALYAQNRLSWIHLSKKCWKKEFSVHHMNYLRLRKPSILFSSRMPRRTPNCWASEEIVLFTAAYLSVLYEQERIPLSWDTEWT